MTVLLSILQLASISDLLLLGLMGVLFVVFVWLIFYQRRQGRNLKYELEQLNRLKENDVESEFVLRAMKLSTWHIDAKTMAVSYDSDFREKANGWIPQLDGTLLEESNKQLHPQDVGRVAMALEDICQGRTTDYREQYRVLLPQTKGFYWEESYATVAERDVEGKPTKIVGTSMRIDDRKAMEQALIEARNRAEESDRMKSAFIANMSHEIRTPLNAIIGFTSVLPDIDSAEERKGLLDLINENTQKLLRIIDDVVNISKIESGQEQVVLSNFDLNLVLAQNVDRYNLEMKPCVKLMTQYAKDSLMITTDFSRFDMIIKHLLSNAVKFTAQGTVVLGYDEPIDGRIHVWVSDTGKGVAEADQERIFERFYKVDEFVPGAGLGLSICRTMAYSLGASVSVESKLGEGSRFTLEIPIQ